MISMIIRMMIITRKMTTLMGSGDMLTISMVTTMVTKLKIDMLVMVNWRVVAHFRFFWRFLNVKKRSRRRNLFCF